MRDDPVGVRIRLTRACRMFIAFGIGQDHVSTVAPGPIRRTTAVCIPPPILLQSRPRALTGAAFAFTGEVKSVGGTPSPHHGSQPPAPPA